MPLVMGRKVEAMALGSVEAVNSPLTMTKTAGSPLTRPASEKEPVGIDPAGEEGLAEGLALLLGRPVGLTLPEGFALLLGAGTGVVVTVEVTVAVVVSVT